MYRIKFGTSGWRGIFGEDFVLENSRIVTQAIADHLVAADKHQGGIVVGHDSRFLGERFARESACVLAGAGISSFLCNRDTPTPVIAGEILRRRASGGINFTASHNPPEYNGIKYSAEWGGPALPETTRDIEERANSLLGKTCYRVMPLDEALQSGLVEEIDPRPEYFAAVEKLIDFQAIAESGMTIAVNPLYSTGRGYLDELLQRTGVRTICVNNRRDPYFGGFPPEPAQNYIGDFIDRIKGDPSINLGLVTDGDAARYGIIDQGGEFIEPNYILALIYDYLLRVRERRGNAARSVATSHFLDAVADYHGRQVYETPVGFKYLGEFIRDGRILVGGEESAGLTLAGHVPEKDGILACLLVAEMVATEGKTLRHLLTELYRRVGEFHTHRENIRLSSVLAQEFARKLASPPDSIGGEKVVRIVDIDGSKFFFEDGAWMLFRKSGTEPVMRICCEARTPKRLEKLCRNAKEFLGR